MTSSKITIPLFLGIAGTVVFNLAPIMLGFQLAMNGFFAAYALSMLLLSFVDRRVLGYATVLSACNPANSFCIISYSFLLAGLTVFREIPVLWQTFRELGKRFWWLLMLISLLAVVFSIPAWLSDARDFVSEMKHLASRLGYLLLLSLAVGSTLRTPRDGVRAIFLLCATATSIFVVFYFFGQVGFNLAAGANLGDVFLTVGKIPITYLRTQVCFIVAIIAVVALALGIYSKLRLRAFPAYLIVCACVFLIMTFASTGSALALICGFAVVVLGYFGNRLSLGTLLWGTILFSFVGVGFYFAVFETDNLLSERIEVKSKQYERIGIDRMQFWMEGIETSLNNPFGIGWIGWMNSKTGHSDWQIYSIAYGWATGGCYLLMNIALFCTLLRSLLRNTIKDPFAAPLLVASLGGLTVYMVNSILDMLSANIFFYETSWALILTAATVITVAEVNAAAKNNVKFISTPAPGHPEKGR